MPPEAPKNLGPVTDIKKHLEGEHPKITIHGGLSGMGKNYDAHKEAHRGDITNTAGRRPGHFHR